MAGIKRPTPNLQNVMTILLAAYGRNEHLHIADVVARTGEFPSAVQPMLDKLEEERWVKVAWDPPARPARARHPLYRLTEEGVRAACRFRDEGARWFLQERRDRQPRTR